MSLPEGNPSTRSTSSSRPSRRWGARCSSVAQCISVALHGLPIAVALCVSLFVAPALANDATFGGAGADLVPLEESRVQMLSEDILIEYRGRWHVTAVYVFENATPNVVKLQVGFPEYRCQNPDEDCANVPFRDLRTEVDGELVPHRVGSVADSHPWKPYLGVVWLYDVAFPPHTQTRVVHRYSVESGADVEGNLFTTYVTRTGAAWAKNIGEARFTFRLPAAAHTIVVPDAVKLLSVRTVDPEGPAPYVEVVCAEKNWDPKGDLFIEFNATARMVMTRPQKAGSSDLPMAERCPYELDEGEHTAKQRQMCRNDEYAVAGYPFKRKALQEYYYGQNPDWRAEPYPWDTSRVWYVRGLRPFPGLPAWRDATNTSEVPASSLADSAPLPPLAYGVHSAPPGAAEEGVVRGNIRVERQSTRHAPEPRPAIGSPPPLRERPGGCGCQVPGAGPSIGWPLIVPLLLALRRFRRESGRGQ